MDSLELVRQVVVKVIMTDDFRKALIDEAKQTIESLENNLKCLCVEETKQLQSAKEKIDEQTSVVKTQIEAEKQRLVQIRSEIEWRIKEVENVENGAELPFRTFEGPVTIEIGDNILKKMAQTEIIMKDWEVVEIRNA